MIDNEPRVREDIVANLQSKTEAEREVSSGSDYNTNVGETFDPSIHERNADGSPRLTKAGKYRRKRGSKSRNTGVGISSSGNNPESNAPSTSNADYVATGSMIAGLFFGTTQAVFGEEWKPNGTEEEQITKATIRYCESQDIGDIPPGWALILCLGVYSFPRLGLPETSKRIRAFKLRMGLIQEEKKGMYNG